ncbi:MAG: DUF1289 domain-containing protein [Ahrensia sp.]|nr:DUF1289 domain-containing protein [Ahrensia sp.]
MKSASPISSPCVLICAIEPTSGHCYGCGRTRDEIAGWTRLSEDQRVELMRDLPARVAKLERRPRRVTKRARLKGQQPRRDVLDLGSGS